MEASAPEGSASLSRRERAATREGSAPEGRAREGGVPEGSARVAGGAPEGNAGVVGGAPEDSAGLSRGGADGSPHGSPTPVPEPRDGSQSQRSKRAAMAALPSAAHSTHLKADHLEHIPSSAGRVLRSTLSVTIEQVAETTAARVATILGRMENANPYGPSPWLSPRDLENSARDAGL
eukprot:COSAG06_NODE_4916_length_3861_cov_66.663477_5_plen_178_part_00